MEDGDSSTNTLLVSLRERERVFYAVGRLPARLPQGDGVISWACRDREAAWICSAARRLGLDVDSFTLAVALLDRVICGTRVPTKYVNCVAAACLSLAKKLCEDHEEDASLYLQRLRLSYSARELKRMELRILGSIKVSVKLVWIRAHVEAIVCDSSVMSHFAPSTLALAVTQIKLCKVCRNLSTVLMIFALEFVPSELDY
ncbi:cyclin domain protein [Teladorsagia circumcincta]|uniref:Cyclin domain protein n=1 Tax=Teladorsagia circumcincta TaxID=45464 RepID=A0A2G9TUT8_TELCI|nr:cyclin domain protein [Teladorsagia circumcincta]